MTESPDAESGAAEPGAAESIPAEAGGAEASPAESDAAAGSAPESSGGEPADRSGTPDQDGPRRRARLEREQRRAAKERAMAIEQSRREAKRRLSASGTSAKELDRRTVRGLKVLVWAALLSVIAVGLGLVLYFTPIMSARQVVVTGLSELNQEEVEQAAAVRLGTPLLQINTDVVAERVAVIRRVASVRVQREYPSSVRISVVERVPVVVKDYPDGPHLFDRDGVDFATAPPPPGLPYLDAETPGPSDPPTMAALEVMTALAPEVADQVSLVAAPSVASITLTLADGRVVVWGTNDRTAEKAHTLAALLTQPGKTYDVSSPDLPTVK